ncbi:hypothetical protein [Pseudovibrio sp. Tun.PSC04-5.I4]|uniref:hypothetical protein n=1 Tax=Pseudovibrio sp. Tun.PSC04-5.I4 TaxID=1798213 RepID=UPI000884C95A|nr:hypothetical protein [Pseudovibrio sp. Tun.PSC04-5.I4]SDQ98948.1 hypothetical protein SAMN04515695_2199 [Pseudovibrio sp. Tun.PSC04-5.I4]
MSSFPTDRPHSGLPKIKLAACEDILDSVMAHLPEDDERSEILEQLTQSADWDAYKFAKNLERDHYWEPDFELVETLAGYSTYSALKTAVEQWVAFHKIKVPFEVGNKITARGDECNIVSIDHKAATVIAQPTGPKGQRYGDTGGYVIPVEDVQLSKQETA